VTAEIRQPFGEFKSRRASENDPVDVGARHRQERRGSVQWRHAGEDPHGELNSWTKRPDQHASLVRIECEIRRVPGHVALADFICLLRATSGERTELADRREAPYRVARC
jgi:hypothetical protein